MPSANAKAPTSRPPSSSRPCKAACQAVGDSLAGVDQEVDLAAVRHAGDLAAGSRVGPCETGACAARRLASRTTTDDAEHASHAKHQRLALWSPTVWHCSHAMSHP